MSKDIQSLVVDRGMALHKIIRLLSWPHPGTGTSTLWGTNSGIPNG
jgi:hypothetical protein